jgi:hypothetical protein
MSRGIIKLPLENGKKELAWYAGRATVNGQNVVSTTIPLKVERDADFVAKRMWLVQWPSFGVGVDPNLSLPAQSSVVIRDGATKRGLSIVPQSAGNIPDAGPLAMLSSYLGMAAPYLIKANNSVFAEVQNPGAIATPWLGDLYLVAEGFKVYPNVPEDFPATIEAYAIPFSLNANAIVNSPAAGAQYVAGQFITITNNGEGKFLAKGLRIKITDALGLDKTNALMPMLALALQDTTSGSKRWNQDTTQDATYPLIPASLLTMAQTFLPFNIPRYIDPNGVVQVQVIWPAIAAAQVAVAAAATFPVIVSIELTGALLPR